MKKKSGFTVIEVALVLAIAGLIFLMAFIALPSLWISQRDADRRARVMEFVSDIKTYQTNNNRGALPVLSNNGNGPDEFSFQDAVKSNEEASTWRGMVRDYVDRGFIEPTGEDYIFYIAQCGDDLKVGENCNSGEFNNMNVTSSIDIPQDGKIYVAVGATCDGDHAVKANSTRVVAAIQILERGGRYCYNT